MSPFHQHTLLEWSPHTVRPPIVKLSPSLSPLLLWPSRATRQGSIIVEVGITGAAPDASPISECNALGEGACTRGRGARLLHPGGKDKAGIHRSASPRGKRPVSGIRHLEEFFCCFCFGQDATRSQGPSSKPQGPYPSHPGLQGSHLVVRNLWTEEARVYLKIPMSVLIWQWILLFLQLETLEIHLLYSMSTIVC